jgi:hypothetical protein
MFVSDSANCKFNSVMSAKRYFARWVDSYNLLFNLFYADVQVQAFSNKLFIEESLVFNWSQSFMDYKVFKFTQPFFIFKDLPHGAYIHNTLFDILLQRLDIALVVDLKNHMKLLGYIQRYSLYSVGLIPVNYSPWKVSYPIPSFSDSNLSQYYFLRWLFFVKSHALSSKHTSTKARWSAVKKQAYAL